MDKKKLSRLFPLTITLILAQCQYISVLPNALWERYPVTKEEPKAQEDIPLKSQSSQPPQRGFGLILLLKVQYCFATSKVIQPKKSNNYWHFIYYMKHHSGFQSPVNQVTSKCIFSSKPVSINKFQKISFSTSELPVVTNSRIAKRRAECRILYFIYGVCLFC